jgi:hypothetical protein
MPHFSTLIGSSNILSNLWGRGGGSSLKSTYILHSYSVLHRVFTFPKDPIQSMYLARESYADYFMSRVYLFIGYKVHNGPEGISKSIFLARGLCT